MTDVDAKGSLAIALGGILTLLGAAGVIGIVAIGVWGSGMWGIVHSFPLPLLALAFLGIWIKMPYGIRRRRNL